MKEHPVAEWTDLYRWGHTLAEVAVFYGISSYTIWFQFMLAGVRPRVYHRSAHLGNPIASGRPKKPYLVVRGRDRTQAIVHRVCWEYYHGPIPSGHVVHHENGNTLDNRVENLACMTPSEHARLHKNRAFF